LAEAAAEASNTHASPTAPQQQSQQGGADTEERVPKTKRNPLKGQASAAASMTYAPPILAPQTVSRRRPHRGVGIRERERASKNTKKNPLNAPVSAAASTSYVFPAPRPLIGSQPPPDAGLIHERIQEFIQELGDLVRGVCTYDTGNRQDSHVGNPAPGIQRQLSTTTVGPQPLVLPADNPLVPSQRATRSAGLTWFSLSTLTR
jgi:hypothetical protein